MALLWLLVFLSLGRLISSGEAQCTLLQLAHISFALVMAYKHLPAHDSDVACVLDAPYTSAVAASNRLDLIKLLPLRLFLCL